MSVEQLVQAELARAVAKFPTWPTDCDRATQALGWLTTKLKGAPR